MSFGQKTLAGDASCVAERSHVWKCMKATGITCPRSWSWCLFKSVSKTFRFDNGSALCKMEMARPSQWGALDSFNIHYTTHRTFGFMSHPKDAALMVHVSCFLKRTKSVLNRNRTHTLLNRNTGSFISLVLLSARPIDTPHHNFFPVHVSMVISQAWLLILYFSSNRKLWCWWVYLC